MKASDFITAAAVIFAAQHSFEAYGCRGNELNSFPDDVIAQRVCDLADAMFIEYSIREAKNDE